jgi:chromosome partitioning protein
MKTIALVTQKGGAGKTTLAATIAVAAMEAGENVIALDLDPQGSLAAWGDQRAQAEREAPAVDSVTADKVPDLPRILKALAGRGYTLALLDCPGVASTATTIAMQSADLSLVPARPTRLDIQATRPTIQALLKLQRPFLFVLNQCPPMARSTRANEAAVGLSSMGSLAEPLMVSRADYQDAIAAGQGVTEYAPNGKAAEEARLLWRCIELKMNPKPKAMTA